MAGRPMRAVYHPALFFTEIGLAAQVRRRLAIPLPKPISRARIAEWLVRPEQAKRRTRSVEQQEAIALALENRMLVLTGGPGTGKTTVTSLIARAFYSQKKRIM